MPPKHLPTGFYKIQLALFAVIYIACLVYGFKTFVLWSQLQVFSGYNPLYNLYHIHGLRYLMAWPSMMLADTFDLNQDYVFSLFVMAFMLLTGLFLALAQAHVSGHIHHSRTFWFAFHFPTLALISFTMNGRLSYMLLGAAMLLYSYVRWQRLAANAAPLYSVLPCVALNLIGLTFLSISSGCMLVGFLTVAILSFVLLFDAKRRQIAHLLLSLATLLPLLNLQIRLIEKNLSYFDNSIWLMFTHGLGRFAIDLPPTVLGLGAAVATFIGLWALYCVPGLFRLLRDLVPAAVMLGASLAIGLFGYSALLTGLPAFMLLFLNTAFTLEAQPEKRAYVIRILREYLATGYLSRRALTLRAMAAGLVFLAVIALHKTEGDVPPLLARPHAVELVEGKRQLAPGEDTNAKVIVRPGGSVKNAIVRFRWPKGDNNPAYFFQLRREGAEYNMIDRYVTHHSVTYELVPGKYLWNVYRLPSIRKTGGTRRIHQLLAHEEQQKRQKSSEEASAWIGLTIPEPDAPSAPAAPAPR